MASTPTRFAPAWIASAAALLVLSGCTGGGRITWDTFFEAVADYEWPPSETDAIEMMYDRASPDNRRKAIGYIASRDYGGEPQYLALYRVFATDPEAHVRAASAKALGMHGQVQDAALLATLLEDDDDFVRWQAADALRKIHDPQVTLALVDRLDPDREEDDDARAAAALALGQYPERLVFTTLALTLEDRSYNVVTSAHRSLVLLTGHDAGLDPRDWADWFAKTPEPFANQQAYTYRPYNGPRDCIDTYITFWNNQDKPPQTPVGLSKADSGG